MALKRKPKAEAPAKTLAKAEKAPEPKAADKPKAAEKAPTVVESFGVSGTTVCLNGVEFSLDTQTFLGLRRAINDQAAGLVH